MDPLCRWTFSSMKLLQIHGSLSPLNWECSRDDSTWVELPKSPWSETSHLCHGLLMDLAQELHHLGFPSSRNKELLFCLSWLFAQHFPASKQRVKIKTIEVKLELVLLMHKIIASPHLGLLFYNLCKTNRLVCQTMDGHSFLSVFAAPHPHHTSCTWKLLFSIVGKNFHPPTEKLSWLYLRGCSDWMIPKEFLRHIYGV